MNPDKRNNYPAFPEVCNGQISPGMSMRDWFAGMALAGILANRESGGYVEQRAEDAYLFADAMIKAREAFND